MTACGRSGVVFYFNFIVLIVVAEQAPVTHTSNLSSMATVDYTRVPIQTRALHVPPLEEMADELSRALRATFATVEVSVVDCPDLTRPPFDLQAPGISGNATLVEVGGPPYLVPQVRRDKVYDLAALLRHLRRDPALLAGAGAGPWPYIGVNCEGIINLRVQGGAVQQGTRVVTVHPVGAAKGSSGYLQRRLPDGETRTALLGNYLLSDGAPGKVLRVVAKRRIGADNFITAIRQALRARYGERGVGLGGAFVVREGRVKHHVMPDFSSAALCSDEDVDRWLHYFEMRAPIVHVGTLVTADLGLDLRVQHFHGFSAHGDGGHYHYDTTPDTVHYEGYFSPAEAIVRVDAPSDTHAFGRD